MTLHSIAHPVVPVSQALALTPVSGEFRVHDLALAEKLGFERPRDIRKLIRRNEYKLLKFGGCATVARVVEGNETVEYYLNQKQAIFLCMKSETDEAFDVQVEIVRVFDAYKMGTLIAPVQTPVVDHALLAKLIAAELSKNQSMKLLPRPKRDGSEFEQVKQLVEPLTQTTTSYIIEVLGLQISKTQIGRWLASLGWFCQVYKNSDKLSQRVWFKA